MVSTRGSKFPAPLETGRAGAAPHSQGVGDEGRPVQDLRAWACSRAAALTALPRRLPWQGLGGPAAP